MNTTAQENKPSVYSVGAKVWIVLCIAANAIILFASFYLEYESGKYFYAFDYISYVLMLFVVGSYILLLLRGVLEKT